MPVAGASSCPGHRTAPKRRQSAIGHPTLVVDDVEALLANGVRDLLGLLGLGLRDHDLLHRSRDLGDLDPGAIRVELFANPVDGEEPARHAMAPGRAIDEAGKGREYTLAVPAARAPDDYTARLIPAHVDAAVPLEATDILWQR